jgi:YHS domain-containing protein
LIERKKQLEEKPPSTTNNSLFIRRYTMNRRGLAMALMLGLGLTSLMNAQDSKMQKESEMKMESKMHEGSMMKDVALHEYCPVAYLAAGKALKGSEKYSSTYKGKTYYFVDAGIKKLFDATPAKYLPKYDSYCATAMAVGKKVESNPELFSVHKNATYLFSTEEAKAAFDSDPNGTATKADKYFAAQAKK